MLLDVGFVLLTTQYLVERIQGNYALQVILNTFLANPGTSATFATILLNFLLKRMKEMGCTLTLLTAYVYTLLCSGFVRGAPSLAQLNTYMCINCMLQYVSCVISISPPFLSSFSPILALPLFPYPYFLLHPSSPCLLLWPGDSDNASLYLKLFKLVFSSVSLFPQENEVMLKVR